MKQVGNMRSRRDIRSVYDWNYADAKHLRQSWNIVSFINYLWRFCRQQSVLLGERNSDNKSRIFRTMAEQMTKRSRMVATAYQTGGKREPGVKATYVCCHRTENACCLIKVSYLTSHEF